MTKKLIKKNSTTVEVAKALGTIALHLGIRWGAMYVGFKAIGYVIQRNAEMDTNTKLIEADLEALAEQKVKINQFLDQTGEQLARAKEVLRQVEGGDQEITLEFIEGSLDEDLDAEFKKIQDEK